VSGDGKGYNLHLCDPYTGEPLHEQTGVDEDDPANYYVKGDKGQSKRWNLNTGDPKQVEKLVRSCLPNGAVVIEYGKGDLMICCPFHEDSNPSCSVRPRKNGCFHCFGCGQKGNLTDLIRQLKSITKGKAIQQMAGVVGTKIEYHQPDKNAVATYSYRNAKGKLIKQVLRDPDENGKKVFKQRQPAKGGDWIWSVAELPPLLFNMDLLQDAEVVCVTEGEKDASTVTDLHLAGPCSLVIGTTSGGAGSWDANLAKELRGKKVVLMPDADEPGARFAADVKASLEAEGIEYRVVTFGDVGQKDVTDFLEAGHSVEELAERIGTDWIHVPGQHQIPYYCSSELVAGIVI
jgi:5S rRNA maturation endonuclease (ribonuclease M5)